MNWFMNVLRGIVIGVANIIPGVSGGTMMVSMGVYDTLIHSITHLFKEFKKSVLALLPYAIGLVLGIVGLASLLKNVLFPRFPLPTFACFIGLILGGLRPLIKSIDRKKVNGVCIILFVIMCAAVILMGIFAPQKTTVDATAEFYTPSWGTTTVPRMLALLLLGALASSAMVIPGVSGSMLMMLFGYYNDILSAIDGLKNALFAGNFGAMVQPLLLLVPFGIGVVVGIFAVAKLIEFLSQRVPNPFYCAVLGLVIGSVIAIPLTIDAAVFAAAGIGTWIAVVIAFAAGYAIAALLARMGEKSESAADA